MRPCIAPRAWAISYLIFRFFFATVIKVFVRALGENSEAAETRSCALYQRFGAAVFTLRDVLAVPNVAGLEGQFLDVMNTVQ